MKFKTFLNSSTSHRCTIYYYFALIIIFLNWGDLAWKKEREEIPVARLSVSGNGDLTRCILRPFPLRLRRSRMSVTW